MKHIARYGLVESGNSKTSIITVPNSALVHLGDSLRSDCADGDILVSSERIYSRNYSAKLVLLTAHENMHS
jgi:hypothetical protein